MRVFEIPAQTIEVYSFNTDEFEKFLQRFNFDFKARKYRPLKWYEKLLKIRYKPAANR